MANEVMAVLSVIKDGRPVEGLEASGLGATEAVARKDAIKRFAENFIDDQSVHSSAKPVPNGVQQPVLSDSHVSSTRIHSSEFIKDDVSEITNAVGQLQETFQKKAYPPPKYEVIGQWGEPHKPTFEFKVTLDVQGDFIEATGKGCPKAMAKNRCAQQAIRQLRQYEADLMKKSVQNLSNGSTPVVNTDIGAYFKSTFHNRQQLAQNIIDRNSDYLKTVEELAQLLDSELKWGLSSDQVVLQMFVKQSGFTLVTTDASSDKGVAANQGIAAKKAVLIIKILLTNDDN